MPTWSAGELGRLDIDGDVWAADTCEFGCPTCDGAGCAECTNDDAVAEHNALGVALRARHATLMAALGAPPLVTVRDLAELLTTIGLVTFDEHDRPTIDPDVDVASVIGLALDDDGAALLAERMNNKMWGPAVGALLNFACSDVAYSYRFSGPALAELTGVCAYELDLLAGYINNNNGPCSLTHSADIWVFCVDWKAWVRAGHPVGHRLAVALRCIAAVDDDDRASFERETGVVFGEHPELDELGNLI